jgi:ATP-binding cassette subfamily F protein uup
LVSHDRAFLNNVVTSTLVFEGDGIINQYVGGYDDWLRQRKTIEQPKSSAGVKINPKSSQVVKKLTYKDQRELDELPKKIELLETQIQSISTKMSESEFYRSTKVEIQKTETQLADWQSQLSKCYKRWEQLEL